MKPDIDKLKNLSDDQLAKISNDINTVGIRKAAEQASKDTNTPIDKTCVQRFGERSLVRKFLIDSPDAAKAAKEVLRFAVTGRPDFSEAAMKVLEETAFKLSIDCADDEEAMKAMNQITIMLGRYRSAAVRERMAKLQEDKLQLRREEFEWKKTVHAEKQKERSREKSQVRGGAQLHADLSAQSEIQEDELGPLAITLDDVERRAEAVFGPGPTLPPTGAPETNEPFAPPSPVSSSRGDEAHNTNQSALGTPNSEIEIGSSVISPSAAPQRPYLQTEKTQADTAPVRQSANETAEPEQSAPRSSRGDEAHALNHSAVRTPNAEIETSPSVISPSAAPQRPYLQSEKNINCSSADPSFSSSVENPLPEKTKAHAIKRWRAHIRRPAGAPEPDTSWRDECPCGNLAPCAEHPNLKSGVRYYRPQNPSYKEGLEASNVPYYKPTAAEIGCTQDDLDKSCDHFAFNPRMKDPPDPRFAPDWLRPVS